MQRATLGLFSHLMLSLSTLRMTTLTDDPSWEVQLQIKKDCPKILHEEENQFKETDGDTLYAQLRMFTFIIIRVYSPWVSLRDRWLQLLLTHQRTTVRSSRQTSSFQRSPSPTVQERAMAVGDERTEAVDEGPWHLDPWHHHQTTGSFHWEPSTLDVSAGKSNGPHFG